MFREESNTISVGRALDQKQRRLSVGLGSTGVHSPAGVTPIIADYT